MTTVGSWASDLPTTTFCWLPPEYSTILRDRFRAEIESEAIHSSALRFISRVESESLHAWRRQEAEIDILVDRHRLEETVDLSVFGDVGDAVAHATHWSRRSMARAVGFAPSTIHRIWKAFNLQPHRTETFKLSADPLFVDKVRDIVGLYLAPPERALDPHRSCRVYYPSENCSLTSFDCWGAWTRKRSILCRVSERPAVPTDEARPLLDAKLSPDFLATAREMSSIAARWPPLASLSLSSSRCHRRAGIASPWVSVRFCSRPARCLVQSGGHALDGLSQAALIFVSV